MTSISKALLALLFAASATWVPAQAKLRSFQFADGSTQAKATGERTQAPKVQAPPCKDPATREAITVSVTPFLKSADPHPLPSIPKRKAKSRQVK